MYEYKKYQPTKEATLAAAEIARAYQKGFGHRWSDGVNPCPALKMALVDGLVTEEDCVKIINHKREGLPMEFCRAPSEVSWYLIDVMEYMEKVFGGENYSSMLNSHPEEVALTLAPESGGEL